jgi:hypothetical protein
MEPSVLGQAIMEGGPDRKIKLDHSAGLDEVLPILLVVYYFRSLGLLFTTYSIITRVSLISHMPSATAQLYIEGYLQAMLEVMYKQEYLRVRVVDDQVISLYYMFAFAMDCILSSSCTFVV